CWGSNVYGQLGDNTLSDRQVPTQIGTGTTWLSVTAGDQATCATKTDGTLWCWGDNLHDALGLTGNVIGTPQQIGTDTTWTAIASGDHHHCGFHTDGTLWCWGNNFYGELGLGDTTPRTTPAQVGSATSWAVVAPSNYSTCATRTDHTL